MRQLFSKALGLLLSVAMMVSFVPGMTVFAAEETDAEVYSAEEVLKMINDLPLPENFTKDDVDQLYAAEDAYYGLQEPDKVEVDEQLGFSAYVIFEGLQQKLDQILEDEVKAVIDLIDALPSADKLTTKDVDAVKSAREAYDMLDSNQCAKVTNYEKLLADEEVLPVLEVSAMIEALPDPDKVVLDDYGDIIHAWSEYSSLTDEQQELIDKNLVDKLNKDYCAVQYLNLKQDIDSAKTYAEIYRDYMTEDEYKDLVAAIDSSEEVLLNSSSTIADIIDAFHPINRAVINANNTVGLHFTVIDDNGYIWLVDSETGLMFEISQMGYVDNAFDMFLDAGRLIYVDDVAVPEDGYDFEYGSIIITLMPDYLKTLSTGEHKLTLKFDNGGSIDIMFSIRSAADVASTGETVNPAVYVGAALLLAAAAAFVVNKKLAKKES